MTRTGGPCDAESMSEPITEALSSAVAEPLLPPEWLAAHVPGARTHLYEGEGHISLVGQLPRILDDLVSRTGA